VMDFRCISPLWHSGQGKVCSVEAFSFSLMAFL
jgi:hypothetical protein